jgi:hypothetical protein
MAEGLLVTGAAGRIVRRQQRLDFAAQRPVVAAHGLQVRPALRARQSQRLVKNAFGRVRGTVIHAAFPVQNNIAVTDSVVQAF